MNSGILTPKNILIALSVILNCFLIINVVGMLHFFLFFSVLTNIGLVAYSISLLRSQNTMRKDVETIFKTLEEYTDHLDEVFSLESFYGDQTIQKLIDHSRQVLNDIVDFEEEYYDDVEVEEEKYDDTEENPPQEDEQ